jgi:hypothetical protein
MNPTVMTGSWVNFYKPFTDSYGRARSFLTGTVANVPEQVCVTATDAEKIQFVTHVLQYIFKVCKLAEFDSHDLDTPLRFLPSSKKKKAKTKKNKMQLVLCFEKPAVRFMKKMDLIETATHLFKSPVGSAISKATTSLVERKGSTYMSAKQAATSFNPVLKFLGVCMSPIYRRKKDGPIGYRLHWHWDVSGTFFFLLYCLWYDNVFS